MASGQFINYDNGVGYYDFYLDPDDMDEYCEDEDKFLAEHQDFIDGYVEDEDSDD